MPTDLEIARAAHLAPLSDIAASMGLPSHLLEPRGDNLAKIRHLPCILVQGRYDVVTRPLLAWRLHQAWPESELFFVNSAGHNTTESPMAETMCAAFERMKDHLAKKGFDPLMGARPMARLIQERVKRPLAEELLFGRLARGGLVRVTIVNDKPAFDSPEGHHPPLPEREPEYVE